MSDKMTVVAVDGKDIYMLHGGLDRDHALIETQAYLEDVRDEAVTALEKFERGEVQVFHQRGIYLARNRKEVAS